MTKHVAVLMGGWSSEREVSLVSGKACAKALAACGYRVTEIDVDRHIAGRLETLRPDVVFNALHGRWGEDGAVQGLLEILSIPYTHSGVCASAMAMDKPLAKRLFAAEGIAVPEGGVFALDEVRARDVMARPYITKPPCEGSTRGTAIVTAGCNGPRVSADWQFGDDVLVERFIPGRELSVAVMDGEALGVLELRPLSGFYDYDAKYVEGLTEHFMPAPIHAEIYSRAMEQAALAHKMLGCRGISRADFRYDDTDGEPGELVMLEINTQPGMTPLSIVPEIAAHRGHSFEKIVEWMVEDASCQR